MLYVAPLPLMEAIIKMTGNVKCNQCLWFKWSVYVRISKVNSRWHSLLKIFNFFLKTVKTNNWLKKSCQKILYKIFHTDYAVNNNNIFESYVIFSHIIACIQSISILFSVILCTSLQHENNTNMCWLFTSVSQNWFALNATSFETQ